MKHPKIKIQADMSKDIADYEATRKDSLLRSAASEIRALRQRNEVLSAKVEMIDLFTTVLMTQPQTNHLRMGGVSEDVAYSIDRVLDNTCHPDACVAKPSTIKKRK
jgi:hypothetical protein